MGIKTKKKLHYFYMFTSKAFCYDQWRKARKIIEIEFKTKCRSMYDGNHGNYYGVFATFTPTKISEIEKLFKEKKLRVALLRDDPW